MALDDTHGTKILFWDVETTTLDLKISTYGLKNYTKYFNHKDITRDWTMLGAAWAFNDEPVRCISVSSKDPLNDYQVIVTLHAILSQADIIVAHNGDRFDIKKFNARAIFYDLEPIIHKFHTYDTLKVAKRVFAFTSNSLSYLGSHLKLDVEKEESPDWNKILEGCPQELSYMRHYNKVDVEVLRQVYYRIRKWDKSHPNINAFNPVHGRPPNCCPVCGSHDTIRHGYSYTRSGKTRRQRFFCKSHKGTFV